MTHIRPGDRVRIKGEPMEAVVLAVRVVKIRPQDTPVDVIATLRTASGSVFERSLARLKKVPDPTVGLIDTAIDALLDPREATS